MTEVCYLRVQIESTNGVVVSMMSQTSISMWAGYENTKRIIHLKDDGTEEELDLACLKKPVPPLPVLESYRSGEALPHVPRYQQMAF